MLSSTDTELLIKKGRVSLLLRQRLKEPYPKTNTAWKCPYLGFFWFVFSRIQTEYDLSVFNPVKIICLELILIISFLTTWMVLFFEENKIESFQSFEDY